MATFVLIAGAGSDAWFWHGVVPELRAHGHDAVPVDLPCDDDTAGLAEYTDAVVEVIGDRTDLVLVAQSMGAFTAPLVCDRVPVDLMILVAAMVPAPGEAPGDWWANTGHSAALASEATRLGFDPDDLAQLFLHDVPPDVVAESSAHVREQSGTPFEKPWPRDSWPDIPTRFLLCRDDRFFPADFLRSHVVDRLGIVPDEMDGGHLPMLSRPRELAARLVAYRAPLNK